jgi:hypothetical protein
MNIEGDGAVSAGDPQSTRKATDITELLLQVYLIAWTMSEAKDSERSEGRTTTPRPAVSMDRTRSSAPATSQSRGAHTVRSRNPCGLSWVSDKATLATAELLHRVNSAAEPAISSTLTRLRDLHGADRRLDERRSRRRTAAQLPTTKRTDFASPTASRRVWSTASRVVSYTASRRYLAGNGTNNREKVYVGS